MTAPTNPQTHPVPDDEFFPAEAARQTGPHPGAEPRSNPAARWLAIVISILLLSLAGVIARELWYRYQGETYDSWLEPVYEFLGTAPVNEWAVAIGIAISLVGLWLLITSFLPRGRTHMRVNSPASIWVRPVDVARKASHTTRSEIGGANIRSRADRKRLQVQVEDDGTGTVEQRVAATLSNEFRGLATPPAISVKVLPQTTQAVSQGPAANPGAGAAPYSQPQPIDAPYSGPQEVQR